MLKRMTPKDYSDFGSANQLNSPMVTLTINCATLRPLKKPWKLDAEAAGAQ